MAIDPALAIGVTAFLLGATLLNCVACFVLKDRQRTDAVSALLVIATVTFACLYGTLSLPSVKRQTTPFREMPVTFYVDLLEIGLRLDTAIKSTGGQYA